MIVGLLLVAAVVLFLLKGPIEGPVLLVLTPDHGVRLADLASVAAVIVATAVLVVGRRRRPPR
jgi:hypothetical protein